MKLIYWKNNLSITEFSFCNVSFHPEECRNLLDECRNLNPDEPSSVEVRNTHTHLSPASTRYVKVHLKVVCV